MVVFRYIFLRIVCLNEGIADGAEIVWIISDTMFIVSRRSRSWFSPWTSILLFSWVLINSCSLVAADQGPQVCVANININHKTNWADLAKYSNCTILEGSLKINSALLDYQNGIQMLWRDQKINHEYDELLTDLPACTWCNYICWAWGLWRDSGDCGQRKGGVQRKVPYLRMYCNSIISLFSIHW